MIEETINLLAFFPPIGLEGRMDSLYWWRFSRMFQGLSACLEYFVSLGAVHRGRSWFFRGQEVSEKFWGVNKKIRYIQLVRHTTYSQWSLIHFGYPQEVSIIATSVQLIWKLYPFYGNSFHLNWKYNS